MHIITRRNNSPGNRTANNQCTRTNDSSFVGTHPSYSMSYLTIVLAARHCNVRYLSGATHLQQQDVSLVSSAPVSTNNSIGLTWSMLHASRCAPLFSNSSIKSDLHGFEKAATCSGALCSRSTAFTDAPTVISSSATFTDGNPQTG